MSKHANHPTDWTLLWLRSGPGLATLRHDLFRQGGHLLALAPWRIVPRRDPASRTALERALAADRIVFTSPAAVSAATSLLPVSQWRGHGQLLAVGAGTAAALHQAGLADVLSPQRMDSEGLLGLPALQDLAGRPVGLVTAPDGRGIIPATLRERGAILQLAEVYDRRPRHLPGRQRARLLSMPLPAWLALGSGKALRQLWAQLSPRQRQALARARVIPASIRLAEEATALGLPVGTLAGSALAGTLLATVEAERLARR